MVRASCTVTSSQRMSFRTQHGTWAIADFGLARAVAETSIRLTSTAEAMGSAFYTAPERWRDAKSVTETADIYSAGKIAQAMLVAGPPAGDSIPPGKLVPIIRRAISHSPQHRHQTATELLTAIETMAAAAVTADGGGGSVLRKEPPASGSA